MWQCLRWKWAQYRLVNMVLCCEIMGPVARRCTKSFGAGWKCLTYGCSSGKTLVLMTKMSLVLRSLLSLLVVTSSARIWLSILQGRPAKVVSSRSIFGISWYKKAWCKIKSGFPPTPNLYRGREVSSHAFLKQKSQWDVPSLGISTRINRRICQRLDASREVPLFSYHRMCNVHCP